MVADSIDTLGMNPKDVSTMVAPWEGAEATSAAYAIAHNLGPYANLIQSLWYLDPHFQVMNMSTKRLNIADLIHPPATAYYLKPSGGAGCGTLFPQPECSTIFEDEHRPIMSLPSQISAMQSEWDSCIPAIFGVYDPPKALTQTTVIGVTTVSASSTSSEPTVSATAASQALPSSTQNAPTPTPTTTSAPAGASATPAVVPNASSQIASASKQGTTAPEEQSTASSAPKGTPADSFAPNDASASADSSTPTTTNALSILQSAESVSIQPSAATTTGAQSEAQAGNSSPSGNAVPATPSTQASGANTGAQSQAVAVTTSVGGQGFTVSSAAGNGVVVNGATIASQGQTTVVAGQTVNVVGSGVVIGTATVPIGSTGVNPTVAAQSAVVTNVAVQQLTVSRASDGGVVVNGGTVSSTALINGQSISVGSNGVVIGTASVALPLGNTGADPTATAAPSAVVTSIAGQQLTVSKASGGGVVINGATITSTGLVNGQTVSVGSNGILIGTASIAIPTAGAAQITGAIVATTVAVGSAAFTVSSASNGGAVVNGITFSSGGPVQTVNGQTVSLGAGGIVIGSSTLAASPNYQTAASVITRTVDGQAFTISSATNGAVVINGVTKPSDGSATTIDGQLVSLGSGAVVIGSSTLAVPSSYQTAAPMITKTVNGQIFTISSASNGAAVINGVTESSGGSAATIAGQLVSLGSGAVIIGSSTLAIPGALQTSGTALTTTIGGQAFTVSSANNGVIVVNGVTESSGESATTIEGQLVSLGSGGLIIGSSTLALSSMFETDPAILTESVGGQAFTVSSNGNGALVVNGITDTAGQIATINGQVVSIGTNDLVIGSSIFQVGSTPSAVSEAILTAGSATLTVIQDPAATSVDVVDGSVSLTMGGAAKTISGVVLSAGSSGVYEDGTLIPLSAIASSTGKSSSGQHSTSSAGPASASSSKKSGASSTVHGAGHWGLHISLASAFALVVCLA